MLVVHVSAYSKINATFAFLRFLTLAFRLIINTVARTGLYFNLQISIASNIVFFHCWCEKERFFVTSFIFFEFLKKFLIFSFEKIIIAFV